MTEDVALNALLVAGMDDWVLLDEVIWEVTQGDLSFVNRARVLDMLQRLYGDGLMVPGDLGETGFEEWEGSAEAWLERSEAELERLGWNPLGAGFWLRLTERGEAMSRTL